MTTRLYLRRPVLYGGDHVDLTQDFGARAGFPFMDGDASLVEMGMRCADGEAAQGTFMLTDPYADPDADPFATLFPLAHNLVTWTEDAPGAEVWLFRGRVVSDEGGRGEAVVDHETEWETVVEDCNVDLRGQAFTEHWVRPEETDIARLIALQAYTLNGASSTAPFFRETCDITVSTTHLAPNTNTVTMPAKKYVAGTQPVDVVRDCAQMAAKNFAVVIHHTGGSHLCLFYTVPGDHTTYVSPITISDHVADWDPEHPTAPVFEPHWERGSATIFQMQQMLSGMVGVWGQSEQTTFVEDTAVRDNYEYWVDSTHTGAQTAAESEDLTAGRFFQAKQLQVTHRASIIMNADQVDMVGAGMTILIRTAATHDPDVESFITRRIVECRFEPRNDGRYWCHMDIERPLLLNPRGTGYIGPIPPVQSEPPQAPTTVYHWGFNGTLLDDTATYSWGNHAHATYTHTHVINPGMGNRSGTHPPMAPGDYTFTVVLNRGIDGFNPGGIRINVYADDASLETFVGQSELVTAQSPTTVSFDVTMPAGTDTFSCEIPYNFSECHDILITTGGSSSSGFVGTAAPPAATDSQGAIGVSPIFSPADHQHAWQIAENTPIADEGGFFDGANVEEALQELAAEGGSAGALVDLIHGQRHAYLASAFRDTDESLYILISDDGKTWTELYGDVYNPADGDFVRDPSFLVFEGKWWVVHTRGPAAGSAQANFGVASSPDGSTWTEEDDVDMSSIAGIDRSWAPQWFQDADGDPHVFVAVTTDSAVTFTIYEVHPTSAGFATWSTPVNVGLGANYIDPFVILKDGFYYLWVKNETTKLIEVFRSTSLTSGYSAWKTGDWAGWGDELEGESIVRIDADTWRIYLDAYNEDVLYYSDSSDDWATWTAKTAVTAPYYMQHPEIKHRLEETPHPIVATRWEPVVFDNAGTPEVVFFQDSGGVWDIVMHEVVI